MLVARQSSALPCAKRASVFLSEEVGLMTGALRQLWDRVAHYRMPSQERSPLNLGSGVAAATDALLQEIVAGVVEGLGFRASMVAVVGTQNGQDVLSVRAFAYGSALSRLGWFDAGKKLEGTILEIGQRIAGQQLIGNYVSLDEMENLGVRVIRENRPFARTNSVYDLFARRIDRETAEKLQALAHLNAFVTVPFRDGEGNLIGNLFAGTDRLDVTDQEIESLRVFSRMATVAIQNTQLLEESEALLDELKRKNSQLRALQDTVSALLESTLSEHRVLQRIVDGVVEGLGFRAAMLAVIEHDEDGEQILPVRVFSVHPSLPGRRILEQGQRLFGRQLLGSRVNVNEEAKKENLGVRVILDKRDFGLTSELRDLWYPAATPRECEWTQRALGVKTFATVPFWRMDPRTGEKELIGNLHVGTDREEITDDEIEALRTFALQASNAIRNAEMYLDTLRISAIASLTSNMAHRLNGIIGKVGGWVQQIQSKARGELDVAFLDDRLERMNNSLAEAAALVDSVRGKAKEEVRIGPVDVNGAVLEALKSADIPPGVAVEKRLDKKLPEVKAIRQHLVEAFRVLISNAVGAMGDSGRLMIVSRRVKDSVEVSVEDTGGGIPENVKGRLFALGTTTKERGLGYGLWWTKTSLGWVEGDIKVESEVGQGSTFTVSLPIPGESAV
jgi:signal transduction histidine kinase/CO dehydrogenase/acetyl-CoA synthase epsilon subunit